MTGAGGISIHAVDIASGRPAEGLAARLQRLEPDGLGGGAAVTVADGLCTARGTLDAPCVTGEGVIAGTYVAEFDVGAFYRALGQTLPDPAFLETVRYRFGVADAAQHYHLPFKFTPWGYSLFRGGQ